jgi:hypothetical protein
MRCRPDSRAEKPCKLWPFRGVRRQASWRPTYSSTLLLTCLTLDVREHERHRSRRLHRHRRMIFREQLRYKPASTRAGTAVGGLSTQVVRRPPNSRRWHCAGSPHDESGIAGSFLVVCNLDNDAPSMDPAEGPKSPARTRESRGEKPAHGGNPRLSPLIPQAP